MIHIRKAQETEMEWVNARYGEVEFVPSHFHKELIAIAELEGTKAGLGRLVTIDEKNLELGGIYVFDLYRGNGVARKIVDFLLMHVEQGQTVYCIPFQHLASFYIQAGFKPAENLERVPKAVLEKFFWCQKKYTHPTSLLELVKNWDIHRF